MYHHFEKGVCDSLHIKPEQISKEARTLLKKAFASAYADPGGGYAPQEEEESGGGMPWKTIGASLAGAAGLYGLGKYNPNGVLGGFSQGVDNWVNPLVNKAKGFLTPSIGLDQEAQGMSERIEGAANNGILNGLSKPSQLHGTQFDTGTVADTPAGIVGAAHMTTLPLINRIPGIKQIGNLVSKVDNGAPIVRAVQRPLLKALGGSAIARGTVRAAGRFAGPLGAISTIPAGLQLGEKLSDGLGVENKWGRRALTAGTTVGSMGTAIGGAMAGTAAGAALGSVVPVLGTAIGGTVGGVAGGLLGSFAPDTLNELLNKINNKKMLNNQTAGRLEGLNSEFQKAMTAKGDGNANSLNAWYGLQTPEMLRKTIELNKGNVALQDQMHLNNPNQ